MNRENTNQRRERGEPEALKTFHKQSFESITLEQRPLSTGNLGEQKTAKNNQNTQNTKTKQKTLTKNPKKEKTKQKTEKRKINQQTEEIRVPKVETTQQTHLTLPDPKKKRQ
ncbi:MAG: hypothetical protein ACTSRF_05440 [Candidatus Freyarchaeota archaeon]